MLNHVDSDMLAWERLTGAFWLTGMCACLLCGMHLPDVGNVQVKERKHGDKTAQTVSVGRAKTCVCAARLHCTAWYSRYMLSETRRASRLLGPKRVSALLCAGVKRLAMSLVGCHHFADRNRTHVSRLLGLLTQDKSRRL